MHPLRYPKDSVLWTPHLPEGVPYWHHHANFTAMPGAVDVIEAPRVRALLPLNPDHGAKVTFMAGSKAATGFTVLHGATRIEGLAENMDADVDDFLFSLVWQGRLHGWRIEL